jgi:hypothetical protein
MGNLDSADVQPYHGQWMYSRGSLASSGHHLRTYSPSG